MKLWSAVNTISTKPLNRVSKKQIVANCLSFPNRSFEVILDLTFVGASHNQENIGLTASGERFENVDDGRTGMMEPCIERQPEMTVPRREKTCPLCLRPRPAKTRIFGH